MTITELNNQLANQHYKTKVNPKNIYVYNREGEHVASISRTKTNSFTVLKDIPMQLLCATVIHFAKTPLRERIADIQTDLILTNDEIETFKKFDLFQHPAPNDIDLTQDQRKVLLKIVQQYHQIYPNGISIRDDNPLHDSEINQ